jgi:L-ascorbate metabolism protein UlaG (beta-lactamase superfamily)
MLISLKWFPPSWIQVNAGETIIYIDPAYLRTNFMNYPKRIEFSKWPDPIDGLPEKLEKGDVILVTHHHKDHCKKVTVNRLRKPSTLVIAPKICAKELGREITVVKAGEDITYGNVKIKAVHAYNLKPDGSGRSVHKKGFGVGYLIMINGKTIYHAGDSDYIPEMDYIEHVDIALLPIGGRGFTMDVDSAVNATIAIKPTVVIPIHRFHADPIEFKEKIEGTTNCKVMILNTGEVYNA